MRSGKTTTRGAGDRPDHHACPFEAVEQFRLALYDEAEAWEDEAKAWEQYHGALLTGEKELDGRAVYRLPGERHFGLAVNGGEYRGIVLFCPFCGEDLRPGSGPYAAPAPPAPGDPFEGAEPYYARMLRAIRGRHAPPGTGGDTSMLMAMIDWLWARHPRPPDRCANGHASRAVGCASCVLLRGREGAR